MTTIDRANSLLDAYILTCAQWWRDNATTPMPVRSPMPEPSNALVELSAKIEYKHPEHATVKRAAKSRLTWYGFDGGLVIVKREIAATIRPAADMARIDGSLCPLCLVISFNCRCPMRVPTIDEARAIVAANPLNNGGAMV